MIIEPDYKESLARAQKNLDIYTFIMMAARDTYIGNRKAWIHLNYVVADMRTALMKYDGTYGAFVYMMCKCEYMHGYIVANSVRGYREPELDDAIVMAHRFGFMMREYECELMLPLVKKYIKDNKDFFNE